MDLLPTLALRNVRRNRVRSVVSVVGVVMAAFVTIMGWGLVSGLDENIVRGEEDAVSGNVLLRPEGYPDDSLDWSSDEARAISPALVELLDRAPVRAWTPRTFFSVRVGFKGDSVRAMAIAYDPERETTVFPRDKWSLAGRWPVAGQREVVFGSGFAELLGAAPGDRVVVEARTVKGAINALEVEVVGVANTTNAKVDTFGVWMSMDQAESLYLAEDVATDIAVRLNSRSEAEAFVAAHPSVDGWSLGTAAWQAREPLALNTVRKRALGVVLLLLILISMTGVANTITMAVYERVREVGTLRAMGMSRQNIQTMFLLEGGVMGLAAGGLGTLLGTIACYRLSVVGIDFSEVSAAAGAAMGSTVLYFHYTPLASLTALALCVAVCMGASVAPARAAARVSPSVAIRGS